MKLGSVCIFIYILIIFLMLNLDSVSGLGLTPARLQAEYYPKTNYSASFQILNAQAEDVLEAYALGDFAEYVTFDKINLSGNDQFNINLQFPETYDKPGRNDLSIRVIEKKSATGGIGTRLEIGARIAVKVPYPGVYTEIRDFNVKNVNEGEPVFFSVEVDSLGYEDANVRARFEVSDGNKVIDTFKFQEIKIKSRESGHFEETIKDGYKAGNYNVTFYVDSGKIISETRELNIGFLFINITNWTSEFLKSKISPFYIEVKSLWNNPIPNVYAEVNVSNPKDGKVVDSFKTPSLDIAPGAEVQLKGFLNAENLNIGNYKAKIILHYGEEQTEKEVNIKIISPAKTRMMIIIAVVAAVILIIVIVIVIYILYRRRKKQSSRKKH